MLLLLYTAGFAAVGTLSWRGRLYYALPLVERPHSPLHAMLKPGGLWGHGLGIIGSGMILLLFLYSARKRRVFGLRWGRISRWLDVHIFLGIIGPLLVTLHTSMKFNGIVAISYFSMLAVMFSGFLGRYIHMQIPRDASGEALSMQEIISKDRLISKILLEEYKISPATLERIQRLAGTQAARQTRGFLALLAIFKNDLLRPYQFWRLRRYARAQNHDIPPQALQEMMRLARQKILLVRRRAFLDYIHRIFHYWHVIHKPFAYVMVIIMFVHISIALTFGYRWIF